MHSFRVLQFNMQFGQGWSDADPDHAPIDLEASIAEIRRHEADAILLQEVERAGPGGKQTYPAGNYEALRRALPGYDSFFAYPRPDERELPFGIGLAIFSRTALVNRFREDLPSPPIAFEYHGRTLTPTDRLVIGATTNIAGREITLLNTHLLAFFMLNASGENHREQRRRVAELAKTFSGPVVLGGDFNVNQHTSLTAQFAEAGFRTVQDREITWRRRPFVLDHIFYNAPLHCVAHQVVPTLASDHHAIVADFAFTD